MASFTANVQYLGLPNGLASRTPHIVSVRPIFTGERLINVEAILMTLAPTIIERVITAVQNYRITWSRERIFMEIRGRLVANNEIDGTTTGFTTSFSALDDITPDALETVFNQIQQSNADILITDIEWTFTIDPISLGPYRPSGSFGAQNTKPPDWAKNANLRNTWRGWGVNCAAYALNYLMHGTARKYAEKKNHGKAVEDARILQEEMGWGEMVEFSELQTFVEIYDDYRISVTPPGPMKTPPSLIFKGRNWAPDMTDISKHPPKTLYLVYDQVQKHMAAIQSPLAMLKKIRKSNNYSYCHSCCLGYVTTKGHKCEMQPRQPKKYKSNQPCQYCGVIPTTGERHECASVSCRICSTVYKRNERFAHRCIILKPPRKEEKNTFSASKQEEADGNLFALWVYDFESRIKVEVTETEMITGFLDDGTHYLDDVCVYGKEIQKHEVNFVCCRNVFTDEEFTYFGNDALEKFIWLLLHYNKGKNICIAHNASGYDTRLLFSKFAEMEQDVKITPIMRGGKFMQLKVNKYLIFRDSLLHVKGSLKNLAKDFCDGLLEKGYFPHLFNSPENYGYVGSIPGKKFFDLSFSTRSVDDLKKFNAWYDTWNGRTDWDFDAELRKYCCNDVHVLQKIVKGYHDIAFEKFGMSPWFNATAPSFVHEVFLVKLGQELELPDEKEDPDALKERLEKLAWEEYWAALKPSEYWFARKALRGGRTDIRKCLHVVNDEEWGRGVRIRYQDICSQYPYQQVVHDFPVGLPLIHTWDYKHAPCIKHQNLQSVGCSCTRETFIEDRFCKWTHQTDQWTTEQILVKQDFFGIVCASIDPPKNMYHPVLVVYDEILGKSVASCNPIIEGCFTSVEFITALKNGYTLKRMHRYDQYHKKPSLWRDIILDLFLEKMINSKNAPTDEKARKLVQDYGDLFGEDFAEKIQNSIDEGKWGKNPAKKQTAKIMMNSAWGKHAQRPIMPEAVIFDGENEWENIVAFFENCSKGNFEFHTARFLNKTRIMYTYSVSGENTSPDLHGGYLPAALFVPAYGRLQLWEQLNMLGKRVLMNDTDSIVYIYDPDLENIPEGSLIGEWEVEDEDRENGGIREFVGLGPKTYGFKCDNNYSKVKAKGISLNLATQKLVNFQTMKKIAQDTLEGKNSKIFVPQKNFNYNLKTLTMHNRYSMKVFRVDKASLKGTLTTEGYILPFGYQEE